MVTDRAFMFQMCIHFGKTFSFAPSSRSRSNIKVTLKIKKKMAVMRKLVFKEHCMFLGALPAEVTLPQDLVLTLLFVYKANNTK